MKDFLSSDHLLESFDGRSYTYGSVLKSNFYHKTTQQDGHYYRANPSNHELLTVRGVDCRVSKTNVQGPHPTLMYILCKKNLFRAAATKTAFCNLTMIANFTDKVSFGLHINFTANTSLVQEK